jgi:hypothetical protein
VSDAAMRDDHTLGFGCRSGGELQIGDGVGITTRRRSKTARRPTPTTPPRWPGRRSTSARCCAAWLPNARRRGWRVR